MASFGNEGRSPVMMSEDAMYDDGVVMEAVVEKFVKYFKSIFHHNSWYFAAFIFCKETQFEKSNMALLSSAQNPKCDMDLLCQLI